MGGILVMGGGAELIPLYGLCAFLIIRYLNTGSFTLGLRMRKTKMSKISLISQTSSLTYYFC